MGSGEKPVPLKVYIDQKRNKVIFAEAEKDFVDVLFSFLTLPMGSIVRLLCKHADPKNQKLGSLSSLYESAANLDVRFYSNDVCKNVLLNPVNSSAVFCQKLRVNLNDMKLNGSSDGAVFVKEMGSFIITDDLNVLPNLLETSIALLNNLSIHRLDLLDERTVYFGLEEFSNLLRFSLLTNAPLTNLVFETTEGSSAIVNSTLSTSSTASFNSYATPQSLKLLVQKSTNKVLCAQVEEFFVEMLFSFLTTPLGLVQKLTMGSSSVFGISNLYNSILSLDGKKYLKSEDFKAVLLHPKLASNYYQVTNFLWIYEANTRVGNFIKDKATFIVSDDLEFALSTSISTLSKINSLGIPVGDLEIHEVSIGEEEALSILKASLKSTSVLTDCLYTSGKNPKTEPLC